MGEDEGGDRFDDVFLSDGIIGGSLVKVVIAGWAVRNLRICESFW